MGGRGSSRVTLTALLFSALFLARLEAQVPIPGIGGGGGGGIPIGGGGIPIGSGGIPVGSLPTIPPAIAQSIIDTLRTGGFSLAGWAIKALSNFIPAYSTLMIPTNEAIAAFVNLNQSEIPSLLLYHAVTGVLPYDVLSEFPVGQRLPTLLFGNQLVVTDNSAAGYRLNTARIVRPNMCGNSTSVVTCHGIDRVLNPSFSLASANGPASGPSGAFAPANAPGGMPLQRPPPAFVIPGPAIAPGAPPVTVNVAPAGANETGGAASSTARCGPPAPAACVALLLSALYCSFVSIR
ncbi:hypothetical protein SELMODRAFT_430281 [Selaginella moellendorffii]|uniref:FAS1 domain-containing protein n=1 Tax=Selaginella moellendorffii TaxID=88036 RepID=D8T8X6_SELML|nr:hypothetical protein SELMODRAFT_430281 [Selaginella moellendorffii]